MTGKRKCELLRAIRREIAERNGIEYLSAECHHEGDCLGTCPKCDAEARFLNSELERLVREGKSVDFVAGVTDMYEKAVNEYREKMMYYLDPVSKCDDDEYGCLGSLRMSDDRGKDRILTLTIDKLDFSVRTYNCLKRAGINTVEDIISLSYEDLMKVRNLSQKCTDEIIEKMDELGFEISHDDDDIFTDDVTSVNETKDKTNPMEMTLEELDLSNRTFDYLKNCGINTVEDLVNYDDREYCVMGSPVILPDLNEVKEKLAELGLTMKNDEYYE